MGRAFLFIAVFFVIFAEPQIASAQRLQIQASALAGTGVSMGMGAGTSIARRSATTVAASITASNSERPFFRYGLTLRGEVEGKVTFGIVPQITVLKTLDRFALGGTLGLPMIVAPRTLYGVEAGGYFSFSVLEWMSVVAQLFVSFYPFGKDLPEDSLLSMVQFYAGLEFHFSGI